MLEVEEYVNTSFGKILVNIYGNQKKFPIVTFHDIGLNGEDNFRHFFVEDSGDIFEPGFCIYNINAPGQEINAPAFTKNYKFPTLDELVTMIDEIVRHFNFESFVGMGIGAGAYLMLKYAVKYPGKLEGLILINCVETKVGWLEWAQEKLNVELLRDFGMTHFTENYLLWHHLGPELLKCPESEIQNFKVYFEGRPNPGNLAAFIDSYLLRSTIEIKKMENLFSETFSVRVLQIVGDRSSFVKDAEYLHSLLDPKKAEILKISDCGGNVLDERPDKVAEAILLFLQGCGLIPWLDVSKAVKDLVKKPEPQQEEKKIHNNQPSVWDGDYTYGMVE